jgi:hypothetical protein
MVNLRRIEDSEMVYRAINNFDGISRRGELLAGAFLRRLPHPVTHQPRDKNGVSVTTDYDTAITLCPGRKAVCTVTAGNVRCISLGPALDVILSSQSHANIINLPYPTGADKQLALDIANAILDYASLVPESVTFDINGLTSS